MYFSKPSSETRWTMFPIWTALPAFGGGTAKRLAITDEYQPSCFASCGSLATVGTCRTCASNGRSDNTGISSTNFAVGTSITLQKIFVGSSSSLIESVGPSVSAGGPGFWPAATWVRGTDFVRVGLLRLPAGPGAGRSFSEKTSSATQGHLESFVVRSSSRSHGSARLLSTII